MGFQGMQLMSVPLITLAMMGLPCCGSTPNTDNPGETTRPEVAVDVRAFEGREQSGVVGQPVAVAPAVIAVDAQGRGVAGLTVTFRVIDGGGQLSGEEVTTNQEGVARVGGWVLGPAPGLNRIAARTPGLPEVLFEATGEATGQPTIAWQEGAGQTAPVGQPLAVTPTVIARDAEGAPREGLVVTFEVVEGGGAVTGAQATTDAQGVARVGSWTMGAEPGRNALEARAEGLPPARLEATALSDEAPTLRREEVLGGLSIPWGLAFLPDGALLFTERGGRVSKLDQGSTQPVRLLEPPSDLAAQGQSGMLGIAVDPEFASNRFIYTYQSSNLSGSMDNRVVRWKLSPSGDALTEREDLLTGIAWGASGGHSGGRLRFGPDGYLYATTGDTRTGPVPQDLTGLGGKVLRIDREGAIPADNPSLGPNAQPAIFAYGFRNPQGLAKRPGTGAMFICEHGPNDTDEVTQLRHGGNGGWNPNGPEGRYIGYEGAKMTDTEQFPDAMLPTFTTPGSAGMAGCDFVSGPDWKAWDGALIVASLAGRNLDVLQLSADGSQVVKHTPISGDGERLREVLLGPDGALYVTTDQRNGGDAIWRYSPQ